jgi:NhaP-type Na+/H+ or K+/H+ antiporter
MASSVIYKHLGLRTHPELYHLEAALSFLFPWAAYYTTEALELSGIVAIMMAGIVMALFTKQNFSDRASDLCSKVYKVIAQIAETYVFVYLGMAFVAFPIFVNLDYRLVFVALGACFVGRAHIFLGSWITNSQRTPRSNPKPISAVYMFVMWFSGLRGGVAFALASVSYGHKDFARKCGGLSPDEAAARGSICEIDDSTAILQTTIMIAAFTIFVFGGTITDVAKATGILEDLSREGMRAARMQVRQCRRRHRSCPRPLLPSPRFCSGTISASHHPSHTAWLLLSVSRLAQANHEYVGKKDDAWALMDEHLIPFLTAGKAAERVKDKERVRQILSAPDSILAGDENGIEWYFRQENEWALARILDKIVKVQGQFRGRLLRKKAAPALRA